MKRLSDFNDENAIKVVADLLIPITHIVSNKENGEIAKGGNPFEFASSLLKNNATDVKAMLAILNETPVEDYHCTGVTVLQDTIDMFSDKELMRLFGLQSKTKTSSGSASEITEVINQ